MDRTVLLTVGLVVIAAMVLAVPGGCQQGPRERPLPGGPMMGGPGPGPFGPGAPGPGQFGPGGPGGLPAGPPPPMQPGGGPAVTVVVAEGVVYVACDGKLIAYEANTLRKLGEATYWEAPARVRGHKGEPGEPGREAPQAPEN